MSTTSDEQAGVDYDARVRHAEATYTAAYDAARADHDAQVALLEAAFETAIADARARRDTEVAEANSHYRSVLGIPEPDESDTLPADVVERFDGDTAAAQEGTA